MIAGHTVRPNSMPGPTGFGFGSRNNPKPAATTMTNSGVEPTTSSPTPTFTHVDFRYSLMAAIGLTGKLRRPPRSPDQAPRAHGAVPQPRRVSRFPPTIARSHLRF